MVALCFDINNLIFKFLNFECKHRFKITNKQSTKLKITDLFNIDIKYLNKLDDKILKNYLDVDKLYASNNSKITKINKMKKIQILHADGSCGLSHFGFSNCVNIKVLHVTNNKKIKNINFLTNLTELHAQSSNGGLLYKGFKNCRKLEILNIRYNNNISTLEGLTNLRILDASFCDILSNKYANECTKLERLCLHGSHMSYDLNKLSNLRTLITPYVINTNDLICCVNLEVLDFGSAAHSDIDLSHLTKLKMLRKHDSNIDSIKNCTSLEVLFGYHSCDFNNLTNLRILSISGANFTTNNIIECTNLEMLNLEHCLNLESIDHLKKLKLLIMSGNNKLKIHEIEKKCTNLKRIIKSNFSGVSFDFDILWNNNIVDKIIKNHLLY
jgi:hypothetical protein